MLIVPRRCDETMTPMRRAIAAMFRQRVNHGVARVWDATRVRAAELSLWLFI
jgi:predicted kinase